MPIIISPSINKTQMEKKPLEIFSSVIALNDRLSTLTTCTEKNTSLASYSIFTPTAAKSFGMKDTVLHFKESTYSKSPLINRAIGSLMAQAMGDSIGSQNESSKVDYTGCRIPDFDEKYFTTRSMKAGHITDDTAMAQCLADSLIIQKGLDCRDFLKRCALWWFHGYNNFTGLSGTDPPMVSHGMGRNSKMAILDFIESGYTRSEAIGKSRPSNGCIMRLAPVPLYYHEDLIQAMEKSAEQARATHSSPEASDSSRILGYVIAKALNCTKVYGGGKDFAKDFLDSLDFSEVWPSLCTDDAKRLVKAEGKWNWKKTGFTFPLEKGGFLALDGLAMSLHCAYMGQTPAQSILKAVNLGGDADTVAAITGQIVGSLYGISSLPEKWCQYILKWDREGEIALKAILLINKNI